ENLDVYIIVQPSMGGCFMQKKKLLLVQLLIVLGLLLGGCFKGEQTFDEVDVPEDVTIVDEEGEETEGDDPIEDEEVIETDETVARELYLIDRSEEHTSELQSRENLVCRLLLEKKN